MPKKGQKTITVKETVYKKAQKKAVQLGQSIAAYVSDLILRDGDPHDIPVSIKKKKAAEG